MIFNKKINPNRFLACLLLIYFVASTLFLTVHSFSHHAVQNQSYQKVLSSTDQNKAVEQCGLCDLFVAQNQIFSFASVAFVALSFYLATIFAFKKRLKLSALLSSNSPRAPPYFS
ncbi:MAG: hypothetical protein V4612_06030 [Pseudomonadota bacterium]